jgi:ABC-2 type transport system permease protein
MFFAQLRNELVKLFGKKRTYIGFAVFILAQTGMMLLFKYGHVQDGLRRMLGGAYRMEDYISALTAAMFMLMPQIALLMPLYATLVGGDIVAKESEDGTLRMILSRPVSRLRLLLVKWCAGIVFAMVLVLVLGATALIAASILFPWKDMIVMSPHRAFHIMTASMGFKRYLFSHLFLAMNASAIVSVAFMFSCFNMKPAAATILALSYLLVSMVMENLEFFSAYDNWFITHHFSCWRLVFEDPIPWAQIVHSEIFLVGLSVACFIIGYLVFRARDIKS